MVELEGSIESPLNREPDVKDLITSFLTLHSAYDRNHGPIVHLDAATHIIKVDGLVPHPLSLSIADLRALPQHTVTCALQCAGNRRHTMRTLLKEVEGIDWGDAAVMNCAWTGVRLRDVLLRAGLDAHDDATHEHQDTKTTTTTTTTHPSPNPSRRAADAAHVGKHVAFACHSTAVQEDSWYGGSIELATALAVDRDVLVALEMNGQPLPAAHGAPARMIIPGVAGARSVKWLDRITVQEEESQNYYQTHDYKVLPPQATDKRAAEPYWPAVPAIQDMPVNSVVALPGPDETVVLDAEGRVEVRGYALPQGAQGPVVRVEVSGDEGRSWTEALLEKDDVQQQESAGAGKWAWCLWRADVPLEVGEGRRIVCRATDAGGNTQDEVSEWNLRGVAYNGWGEVRGLTVRKA